MATRNVAVIVGSLRKQSFNRKIANELVKLSPATLKFNFITIGDLPLFSEDLEAAPPAPWVTFRQAIKSSDGVLFFTPEYNRSVPAALKNALDVGSRPYGQSVWNAKPGAIVSVSVGGIGGFGANHHLRQSLAYLNVPTMGQPEAYIGSASTLFDTAGNLTNDNTKALLTKFAGAYAAWVETHLAK